MAYTNVQFIGYVLDTAPQTNPDGSQTYLGLSNPQLDIEARCDLMLRAMQTARGALPQQSPPRAVGYHNPATHGRRRPMGGLGICLWHRRGRVLAHRDDAAL